MRICMFTRSLPEHYHGGMEQLTQDLCCGLVNRGHEVDILTTGIKQENRIERLGITTHYLGPDTRGKINTDYLKKASQRFQEIQRDKPFDIVHSQGTAALYYVLHEHRDEYSPPLINTPHGTHLNEIRSILHQKPTTRNMAKIAYYLHRYYTCGKDILHKSDAIIAISDDLYTRIPAEYGVDPLKVHKIYNGIDTDVFKPKKGHRKRDKIILLAVSNLIEQKGIQYLLKAIPYVDYEVHLTIIGSGPYQTNLETIAKNLNLDVDFAGRIPNKHLPTYFSNCDLFIFPTARNEGLPLTVLEAMSCGAITIASNIGGIPSIIDDGFDGILTHPKEPRNIANAINTAINNLQNNPVTSTTMKNNARNKIKRNFSIERMAKETESLYDKLIQKQNNELG